MNLIKKKKLLGLSGAHVFQKQLAADQNLQKWENN